MKRPPGLCARHHPVSHAKVAQLLHDQHYSLQSNRRVRIIPIGYAQFRHISTEVKKYLREGLPVISVGTKEQEILGNYEN